VSIFGVDGADDIWSVGRVGVSIFGRLMEMACRLGSVDGVGVSIFGPLMESVCRY
jgi:hypothetical protein